MKTVSTSSHATSAIVDHTIDKQRTISGATEMFRDPDYYQIIRHELLPYLETFSHLNIWHAGCSTGEEAYSMAILLKQAALLEKTSIYATDKYKHRILQGKKGRYAQHKLPVYLQNFREANLPGELDNYVDYNPGYLQVKKALIPHVNFFQHDLLKEESFNSFSCIFCRNVLFYYTAEEQIRILDKLLSSLDPHGFLILGRVEDLRFSPSMKQLKALHADYSIYQKITF